MSSQFYLEFVCEHAGRRMHVGCDSRLTMETKTPVVWERTCICGRRVRVTRFRKITNLKHIEPKDDKVVSLADYRNKVIPFPKKKEE